MDPSVVFDNWGLLLRAAGLTALLTVAVIVISTILAFPLGILRQATGLASWLVAAFSWTMRASPTLVLLYFVFYGLPQMGFLVPAVTVAIIGLSIQATGYALEVVRGGLLAIDPRQHDAVKALGIPRFQAWRKILLPQALVALIPPYFSNTIHILQATTIASVITVSELTGETNNLIGLTYRAVPLLIFSAIIYLIFASVLTGLQAVAERRFAIPGTHMEPKARRRLLGQPGIGARAVVAGTRSNGGAR